MSIREFLKTTLPEPLKNAIKKAFRPIINLVLQKEYEELRFWRQRFEMDNGKFKNDFYSKLLLNMAEESCDRFLEGKIVADFGCGPRGSLVWAKSANLKIGIDVLADGYADTFTEDIKSHGMIYVKSTEKVIPIPSEFVDVLFTLNAIDHVNNFPIMCAEILRIIKPGGLFVGGFNLEEPATACEPHQLNEQLIQTHLLNNLEIESYRITRKGPPENHFEPFFTGNLSYEQGEEGYLWVRASKPNRIPSKASDK